MAVEPVVYGTAERPPRGDYTRALADYTCTQQKEYSALEHARYSRLCERQLALLEGRANDAFIASLPNLGLVRDPQKSVRHTIPRFEAINERLMAATGWQIVAVPGLIPEVPFFSLLAAKKFPVTDWLREESEFDYIVEPDIFHDLFGHVPQLFNKEYADYIEAYGKGALKAHALGACEWISRLYWYTIEFGLMRTLSGVRAYGAGILSSPGELQYSVEDAAPNRIMLDVERCMRTRYKIDTYQQTYFVIESFGQLVELTKPDFEDLYKRVTASETLEANSSAVGDSKVALATTAS
jgi:phenylalanine-4-hydroxylase